MDRRSLLKNLALVVGGTILLPSCLQSDSKTSIALQNLQLNGVQEKLIAELAETIIPKTKSPGAKDMNLHLFVMKMVDDCSTKVEQEAFAKGLSAFEKEIDKVYNKPFTECSRSDREQFLTTLDKQSATKKEEASSAANEVNDMLGFYKTVKGYTIFGYTNSHYFMTKEVEYKLIPDRYNAHYPAKQKEEVKNG